MPVYHDPGEPRRVRRARYHARRQSTLRRLAKRLYPRSYRHPEYTLRLLPAPEFVGYARSFVPNVAEGHPLFEPLAELLPWVDREWIDTDKTFPVSKKRRKRRRRRKTVQTLRTVSVHDLAPGHRRSVPAHLHGLLELAPAWLDADGLPGAEGASPRPRRFRVANPEWYRLRTRRLVRTHESVPSEATRQRQSLEDRSESNGLAHAVRNEVYGGWHYLYRPEPLASRRSRVRAQEALDGLGVRPLRIRW